jgi:hypothetical protein
MLQKHGDAKVENVINFPPRYLHPEKSDLGRIILEIARRGLARNVEDLARMTGANPAIIDALLDRAVAQIGGVA